MQKGRFGYRLPVGRHGSLPLQFADSPRRFSLVLLDDFLPANAREENPTAALFLQLSTFYPDLHIDAVVGDAGFGYDIILNVVYNHLHARRVIAWADDYEEVVGKDFPVDTIALPQEGQLCRWRVD